MRNVYLELDTVLDTRLPIMLYVADLKPTPQNLKLYRDRASDNPSEIFPNLTEKHDAEFHKLYKQRDVGTLMQSRPTQLNFRLSELLFCNEMEILSIDNSEDFVEVSLNVYPYKLEPWEIDDIIASLLLDCGPLVRIKAVDVPAFELDFNYIKAMGFVQMYMYDLRNWIEIQFTENGPRPIPVPECCIIAPAIAKSKKELMEIYESEYIKQTGQNPFDNLRIGCAAFVGLAFQELRVYSLFDILDLVEEVPQT